MDFVGRKSMAPLMSVCRIARRRFRAREKRWVTVIQTKIFLHWLIVQVAAHLAVSNVDCHRRRLRQGRTNYWTMAFSSPLDS